jgi:NAD(P)-dependent dehydrogenase (short-subunit alcohol dehydrogenase family)
VLALGRDLVALEKLAAELGVEVAVCDVSKPSSVATTFSALSRVDVLVSAAGVSESAPLAATSLESWEEHLAVNATGPFLCTRAVVPGMLERRWGRVVTVASTAGRAGSRYITAYAASKHAAVGLMRAVAAEVAGTGVTANAVCPAFVDTPMTKRSVARIVSRTGRSEEEARAVLSSLSPLGRLVEPEEVAAAVVYLASEEAGAVNGQALVLDGGGVQA